MRSPVVLMAAALLSLGASAVLAQDPGEGRRPAAMGPTIAVTGTGEVSVDPDLAVVRLGVGGQEESAQAVQTKVNQSMQKILEAIRTIVPPERVQTSSLSLYPVYAERTNRNESEEPRIVGYRAETTITIRVTDLKKVGEVIDAGLGAGANRLQGIHFDLQNDTQAKSQALQKAVRSAQEKARAMAEALDVQLLGIVDASEIGAQVFQPTPAMEADYPTALMRAAPSTPVAPGSIQVRAELTLRYRFSGQGLPGRAEADGDAARARPGQERISAPPPPR